MLSRAVARRQREISAKPFKRFFKVAYTQGAITVGEAPLIPSHA